MIVIAGPTKSGKTSVLAAACMADPIGRFVKAPFDTKASLLYRWPTLRLLPPGYSPGVTLYIDEPVDIEDFANYMDIAAVTVRVEKQVQP